MPAFSRSNIRRASVTWAVIMNSVMTTKVGLPAAASTARSPSDVVLLWEHLVLDTLLSLPVASVGFWRDKQQREVDFVIPRGRTAVDAIECKWNAADFETRGLAAFRSSYPHGRNFVVSPQVSTTYTRRMSTLEVAFLPVSALRTEFAPAG